MKVITSSNKISRLSYLYMYNLTYIDEYTKQLYKNHFMQGQKIFFFSKPQVKTKSKPRI